MRQAYDYWQDQPGISCGDTSAHCTASHPSFSKPQFKMKAFPNNLQYQSAPHFQDQLFNDQIVQTMLQKPFTEIHDVPCTLFINPTTLNEYVLTPLARTTLHTSGLQPSRCQSGLLLPWGSRPLYNVRLDFVVVRGRFEKRSNATLHKCKFKPKLFNTSNLNLWPKWVLVVQMTPILPSGNTLLFHEFRAQH